MLIAIDYDDTYTKCPDFWSSVIQDAEILGHEVICVTCRRDTPENREDVKVKELARHAHYFTGMASKKWFLEQLGLHPDVWIDDDPASIIHGK